jgi:hypothetical protein
MDEQKNQNPQPQPATDVAAKSSPPGAVVAGGAGEKPAVEAEKSAKPEVTEHPIDAAEAKKFEGAGDFAMPVSPLSEAVKAEGQPTVNPAAAAKAGPANQTGAGIEKPNAPQTVPKSMTPPPAKIEDIQTQTIDLESKDKKEAEKKSEEPQVKPTIIAGSTKDLEKKAKDLLKDLDKSVPTTAAADGGKPKKKRRSGGVTKMALAAVLVVMMGAGGVVGVNLFKMNQSTETRSQAASCSAYKECSCYPADEEHCAYDSNGAKNYFTIYGCSNGNASCNIICQGTKDCEKEVAPPPVEERCSDPDAAIGADACSTKDGKNTGQYCECQYVSGMAVWRCEVNLSECPTGDDSVAGAGACIGANGSLVSAVGGVEVKGNCLVSTNGQPRTFYSYKCDNMETDENKGCQEDEKLITAPQACLSVPSEGWCGILQIDYPDNENLCFVSTKIPCPSKSPEPSDEPVVNPLSCTGLQSTAGTAPKIGNKVVFTCSGQGDGLSKYEFQYKIDDGAYVPLAASTTDKSKSVELTISQAGVYKAQCRVCKADNTCTAWGAAQ